MTAQQEQAAQEPLKRTAEGVDLGHVRQRLDARGDRTSSQAPLELAGQVEALGHVVDWSVCPFLGS